MITRSVLQEATTYSENSLSLRHYDTEPVQLEKIVATGQQKGKQLQKSLQPFPKIPLRVGEQEYPQAHSPRAKWE